jgi:hypothetical protein
MSDDNSTTIIIAVCASVGGLLLILAVIGGFLLLKRRRNASPEASPTPSTGDVDVPLHDTVCAIAPQYDDVPIVRAPSIAIYDDVNSPIE